MLSKTAALLLAAVALNVSTTFAAPTKNLAAPAKYAPAKYVPCSSHRFRTMLKSGWQLD
ncbi:MAG: hypothetical protein QOI20_3436 [Acidimicrobiaceae bacterium]|nr:hypothetical protein [Acidimicrobiaceae bacterium]